MSSIAYVTDEKMIEYHRLCGNRSMNFWRLSARSGFTNFRRGDLLFFYARRGHMRSKALLGYAHYVATEKLSLRQMWNKYGNANGYDSKEQMEEAIRKAARSGKVPEKLNCLYLSDAVYFREPVIPEEIGITISSQLESYCYLDREDPQVTVRILKQAEKGGIDLENVILLTQDKVGDDPVKLIPRRKSKSGAGKQVLHFRHIQFQRDGKSKCRFFLRMIICIAADL